MTEPAGLKAKNKSTARSYRAVQPHLNTGTRLGPLTELPGFWEGQGFSLIARPSFDPDAPDGIFLQLNMLHETIEFKSIGSPVPNRGSQQPDINIFGVTYLHRVTDEMTGGALHIEPGIWLNVPPTSAPHDKASVARLSTIPHGNSVCAVGFAQYVTLDGIPDIPPANTVPFEQGSEPPAPGSPNPNAVFDLSQQTEFRTNPLAPRITQAIVDDPNQLLRDQLQGRTLTHVTRLITNTTGDKGGISSIPFLNTNADTVTLESVFAIEHVQASGDTQTLQLQYSQTALLNFGGRSYPHVTVGTLTKAF